MKRLTLPSGALGRFRELTVVVFLGSIVFALIGVVRTIGGGASALLLGWGIAAAGFGMMFAVRALISFLYNDADYVEAWSTMSAFMFILFALAAFNWFGVPAAVLVVTAWTLGKAGRRQEEVERRAEVRARQAAIQTRKRTDTGPGPAAAMLQESALDLNERSRQRESGAALEEHPGTRRASIDRARMIDGNPWHLPPDGT